MNKILTALAGGGALIVATTFLAPNLNNSNQNQETFLGSDNTSINSDNSSVKSANNSNDDGDMKDFGTFVSQQNDQSSQSQQNTLNVNAADVSQPHILSINSSATELKGEIAVDGRVVKKLNSNSSQINLSPYLSVGQHKVEIYARYSPPTSGVNVTINGPGTNVTQQNSGEGTLNYKIDVNVQ